VEFLNLWRHDTFIQNGSALILLQVGSSRAFASRNSLEHSSAALFEAGVDCDELECDVAWLVSALQ
jgi:hypothetical protein